MDLFDVVISERAGWTVVRVVGQLDVATAPDLRQALIEAQFGDRSRVVLDLDGVEFLDSMGLGVIVGGLKRARTHGGELALVCSQPRVRTLLEVTRIAEIVPVAATVDEVVRQ